MFSFSRRHERRKSNQSNPNLPKQMSLKLEKADSLFSTRNLMKMPRGTQRADIGWDDIFNNRLEVESVFDARGNVIPERQNIVNESGESLAIMQGRFRLLQPSTFKEMMQEAIGDIPHKITLAGSFNGQRNYICGVEFDNSALAGFSIGADKHVYSHLFAFACDGSGAMSASGLITRLFCTNQFRAIFAGAERAKNTENGQTKYQTILSQIEGIERMMGEQKAIFERMGNASVDSDKAKQFLAGLLAKDDSKAIHTKTLNVIDDTHMRFSRGIENHGSNRFDLFNAVTERFSHEAGKEDSNLGNSIIGTGASVKSRAMGILSNEAEFAACVTRGASLLALAN